MNLSSLKQLIRERLLPDYDTQALTQLSQFSLGYIPWTLSAMRPAGIRLAVNEILIHGRRSGIEFGAGISTLFLAKAFSLTGGRLVTVDHDGGWLAKVGDYLRGAGIEESACALVHAPLAGGTETGAEWYDAETLDPAVAGRRFDFALIDGPVAEAGKEAIRGPACGFLKTRLEPSYAVFVDDIDRPRDLALAKGIARELRGKLATYKLRGCVGVIRPAEARPYNIC